MSPSRELALLSDVSTCERLKLTQSLHELAEAIAIQTPLSVVADLFAKGSSEPSSSSSSRENEHSHNSSEDFYARVRDHFSSVLADHLDAIPHIENVNTPGRLARFRCMIQDTGLPNEVFVLDAGGDNGRGCCAYSEGAASGSPVLGYDSTDYSQLRERQVVYATSIPGETEWYKLSSTKEQASTQNAADGLATELSSRLQVNENASTSAAPRNSFANKFPLPGAAHTGALVKLYPTTATSRSVDQCTDNVKVTEIADFVGVVDFSSFPNSSSLEEPSDTQQSTSHLPEQIKTLHAIYRIPNIGGSHPKQSLEQPSSIREDFIDELASVLEGDRLAAEWLLVSLLGKIHTRRGALALGQLPINLVLPLTMDDTAGLVNSIQAFLHQLLPRLVKLDVNVANLNKFAYMPESKDENLISGVLQLPQGTVVLVDETRMGEGSLQDRGVKNLQALATVVRDQTLDYVFPYSSFTFETDLTMIVVSKGKSLLPIDCTIHLRPSSSASESTSVPSSLQLTSWRTLLTPPASDNFAIPEAISEYIQADFIRMRQNKTVTQEDLVLRMSVARLLAISRGKSELDSRIWEETKGLDEARKARQVR